MDGTRNQQSGCLRLRLSRSGGEVVLFELLAYRRDNDVGAAEDLEERHIARANGDKCLLGQVEIPTVSLELAVENEVEQALQIRFCVAGQADAKTHPRVAGLRLRAASNLR